MRQRRKEEEEAVRRTRGLERDSPSSSPAAFPARGGGGEGVTGALGYPAGQSKAALAGRSPPAWLSSGEQR